MVRSVFLVAVGLVVQAAPVLARAEAFKNYLDNDDALESLFEWMASQDREAVLQVLQALKIELDGKELDWAMDEARRMAGGSQDGIEPTRHISATASKMTRELAVLSERAGAGNLFEQSNFASSAIADEKTPVRGSVSFFAGANPFGGKRPAMGVMRQWTLFPNASKGVRGGLNKFGGVNVNVGLAASHVSTGGKVLKAKTHGLVDKGFYFYDPVTDPSTGKMYVTDTIAYWSTPHWPIPGPGASFVPLVDDSPGLSMYEFAGVSYTTKQLWLFSANIGMGLARITNDLRWEIQRPEGGEFGSAPMETVRTFNDPAWRGWGRVDRAQLRIKVDESEDRIWHLFVEGNRVATADKRIDGSKGLRFGATVEFRDKPSRPKP